MRAAGKETARSDETKQHPGPDVGTCRPVSYTHLDVYKRQVVEALRQHYGLDPHPVRVIEPFQMLGEIEEDLQEIMGIDSVSYTHLDVYKRQDRYGLSGRCRSQLLFFCFCA